jgi:hypothetical protein
VRGLELDKELLKGQVDALKIEIEGLTTRIARGTEKSSYWESKAISQCEQMGRL